MNPATPNTPISGGKSLGISSHSPLQQQQIQVASPNFESSSRRSSTNSSIPYATSRNNQSRKKQHKNSRRPGLGNLDDMAESNAVRNPNSRRGQTSITHLMNFTLPPRPQDPRNSFRRGSRRATTYGIGSGHHSIDKARYIHANYRFIVRPTGDYKPQAVNSDEHLDWGDVLQILASAASQDASCPICLSHPVAPRMAKCGHIFCLPCLIRYMHSEDGETAPPEKKARWKKCPICWDSVYISDTKPVRFYEGQEGTAPQEGDDVVLRLMMRQPGSTLALPRDGADALSKGEDIPWYFAAEVMDYARIMKGTEEYMMEQYNAESEDLRRQENEDELMFGEDPEWTRKAIRSVTEAMDKINGIGDAPASAKQPAEKKPTREPILFSPPAEEVPEMYLIQQAAKGGVEYPSYPPMSTVAGGQPAQSNGESSKELQAQPKAIPLNPKSKHIRPSHGEAHHPDAPYYFYQALLHYYLAPLDFRILKAAFGNYTSFPSTLLPRVERVSTGHIMDDEMRKRAKYLAHLPYGCEVGFLECNWTDVVVPEVLVPFKEEIEARRKRNREKETREERDRVRAERAEDKARWAAMGKIKPALPHEGLSAGEELHLLDAALDAQDASPPWPTRRQGSSFASLASPSTSPNAPRTVWGTAMITPASAEPHAHQPQHDDDDGWLQWEPSEAELIAQVEAASLAEGSNATRPSGSSGQGKKKKAKKITLMSTTARRAA